MLLDAPDLGEVGVHAVDHLVNLSLRQLGGGGGALLGRPLLARENVLGRLLTPLTPQNAHAWKLDRLLSDLGLGDIFRHLNGRKAYILDNLRAILTKFFLITYRYCFKIEPPII